MGTRICVGMFAPERIMTNADLEKLVDTSDQWIVDRTGIHERHIAADHETAASIGTVAARRALETAGLQPSDIDLVICATVSGDGLFPATASVIQDSLGCGRAGAFDVNAACVGFLSAFTVGSGLINSGTYKRILVVGSEVLSRITDWTDRGTCVLFGDAAGAVVLEQSDAVPVMPPVLRSDGSLARILYARGPASSPLSLAETEGFCIVMDGREVFRIAVRAMEDACRQAVSDAGLQLEDIDFVVPHQANHRIISAVAKGLDLPADRVIVNVGKYGNTSSASIPVALSEAWQEGKLTPGDKLLFVAFGGGLVWGATVVQWTGLGPDCN